MSDFQNFLDDQLRDPEFRKEYDAARLEHEQARSLIATRLTAGAMQEGPDENSSVRRPNMEG